MRDDNRKALFITFEGIDGSGKSTIAQACTDHYKKDKNVILTKEPGYDTIGQTIRNLLLHHKMDVKTELLLFAADRANHVETLIKPMLDVCDILICDRYTDSTIAYQFYGKGNHFGIIDMLNRFSSDSIEPDAVFILDVDIDIAKQRLKKKNKSDLFDNETTEFMQKVRSGYLALADIPNLYKKYFVINANKPVHNILNEVVEKIDELLLGKENMKRKVTKYGGKNLQMR